MSDQTGTQEPADKPIDESADLDVSPVPRNEDQAVSLPPELLAFVNEAKWTYAKTMPKWPHEYIVREQVDIALFERLVRHIRKHGYEGKFYQKAMIYYGEGGMVYWTMGAPVEETTIINRCREEDSYECRLKTDTLRSGTDRDSGQK